MSFGVWVNMKSAPTGLGRMIAGTYDWDATPANQRGWLLGNTFGSADVMYFYVFDSGGNSAIITVNNFYATYGQRWVHMEAVYIPSTAIYLYIDGKLVGSDTSSVPAAIAYSSVPLRIGLRSDTTSQGHWHGYIDEPRLYNYARTAAQIQTDFAARGSTQGAAAQFGSGGPGSGEKLSNGLVAYYPMDESAANTCTGGANDTCDKSGNTNDGAWSGDTASTTGKFSYGTTYDGTGDYITVTNHASLNPTSAITLSSWVYLNNTSAAHFIITKATTDQYYLRTNNTGKVRLSINSTTLDGNTTLSTSTWYHLVGVYDGKMQYIYINGVLDASQALTATMADNSTNVEIGNGGLPMSGKLDEVRIYNRALDPREVAALSNFGPPPVAYWNLDENTSTTVNDRSGNNHQMTMADIVSSGYVQSVEYVEISLTDGNTSASSSNLTKGQTTANSVPFVTAKWNSTGETVLDAHTDNLVDIYFESGPKVTATRAGSGGAVDVGVYVVEFDPTYITVQQGVLSFAGTSDTDTITAVDQTKAAMTFYYKMGDTNGTLLDDWSDASVAGWFSADTTLSWQRNTDTNTSIDGHYYVFEALNSEFSVQASTFSIADLSTSNTVTISSINTAKTFVIGSYRVANANDNADTNSVAIYLNSATTVGAIRDDNAGVVTDIRTFAITFAGNETVQRGTFAYASNDAQETATITSVDTNYAFAWNPNTKQGTMQNSGSGEDDTREAFQRVKLTAATTVQGDRTATGANTANGRWEVIGLEAPTETSLQPAWSRGKFGSALNFDGSDDYISHADHADFDLTNNMTFSTWIYPTAVDNQRVILGKGTNYILQISSGKLRLYNGSSHDDTGASLVANQWLHVGVTVDASNVTFYQNGIVSSVIPRAGTFTANTSSFRLGFYEGGSSTHYWSGIIDDVKVYNYARTPGQIIEDMNGGHPVGGSPIGSQAGWWKFDDGSLTTAQDSGPNNNDMTLSTATSAWTNSGKFGKAWDGNASRYVSRADDADFDFAASEDFTLSTWIKTDGTSAGASEYVLNKSSATAAGYGIYGSSGGKVVFAIDDDATWTPDDQAQSTTNIYDQAWHYIAARKTGTTKIDLFVDGKLEASDATLGATGSMTNAIALYIGDRDGADNGDEFNGDIDEVKVYRAALSNDQILIDYNRGKSAVMGSTSTASDGVTADNSSAREYCIPGDTTSCSAPVAEWKFDENTGTAANDTSGSGNNGALNTFPTNPWRTGIQGSALEFDGADDDITAGTGTTLDVATSATFTAWIKPDDAGEAGFGTIIAKGPGGGLGYQFYIDDNTDAIAFYDGISTTTSASVTYGVWQHVALTINSGAATFYVNGVILDTDTVSLDATGADTAYLGSIDGGTESFDGLIDNIRVYNYARTPAQIAWEYNRGTATAWYKLDECQGTTAYNSAKSATGQAAGNNGAITIGATGPNTSAGTCTGSSTEAWKNGVNGKINNSLDFDGTDDVVTITNNTAIDFDLGLKTGVSFAAWFYANSDGEADTGQIFNKGTNTWCRTDSQSASTMSLECSLDLVTTDGTLDIANVLTTNTWHHVVMTYDDDADDEISIYIDGRLRGTSSNGSGAPAGTDTSNLLIGGGSSNNFDGLIDEMRVYPYGLTLKQVLSLYGGGAVQFAPITGSP